MNSETEAAGMPCPDSAASLVRICHRSLLVLFRILKSLCSSSVLCLTPKEKKTKIHIPYIELDYLGRAPVGKKDLRIHSSGGLCFLLGRWVRHIISTQLLPILIGFTHKGSSKCFAMF